MVLNVWNKYGVIDIKQIAKIKLTSTLLIWMRLPVIIIRPNIAIVINIIDKARGVRIWLKWVTSLLSNKPPKVKMFFKVFNIIWAIQ